MSNEDIPPQPKAILRGHKAQVHAATFIRSNERLLTGDADGYVIVWDLTIMRATAVWNAHENAILGISEWAPGRVITHGRDNKLIVWKLSAQDETAISTILPLDPAPESRLKPWMLHLLEVNTMNFCSFASCPALPPEKTLAQDAGLLIAVPNTLASEAVDIYSLPAQTRLHTVKLGQENGMAMAVSLVWITGVLTLIVGYENGLAVVAQLGDDGCWSPIYRSQCHKQPILSVDVAPNQEYFLTSSADAIIAKHPLLLKLPRVTGLVGDMTETSVPEVESGDTNLIEGKGTAQQREQKKPRSALSAALASHNPAGSSTPAKTHQVQSQPLKFVNTKHSGQQSLRLRSDGRIFATAGWDSKVRVYSAKTLREVAVLKWHPVGCFAVAFAKVESSAEDTPTQVKPDDDEASLETRLVPRMLEMTVKDRRISQAKNAHWLAAGSKDGKVSLWDIF
ncbi:ASTRA-associated protein 1 [Cytospora mali]|uniref:ASTRA-associated protein 1 n=1 Tax=Cytospora mali TaxID=578113 RepID=A0A194USG4_CYTMA|nr:ASTRA-associated protein 1 [Valsa mali var. pyri (nom. inval.)]